MNEDSFAATRTRLLDEAQSQYALGGLADMTLRSLIEKADVSVPTLSQHFRNRDALLTAMLNRVLRAASDERLALLQQAREECELPLSATQIIGCMALPAIREITCRDDSEVFQLLLRASCELDAAVRTILERHFAQDDKPFRDAFAALPEFAHKSISDLRLTFFLSELPGTGVNSSLLIVCRDAIVRRRYTHQETLVLIGSVVQSVISEQVDLNQVNIEVEALLTVLHNTRTIQSIRMCERLIPEQRITAS